MFTRSGNLFVDLISSHDEEADIVGQSEAAAKPYGGDPPSERSDVAPWSWIFGVLGSLGDELSPLSSVSIRPPNCVHRS